MKISYLILALAFVLSFSAIEAKSLSFHEVHKMPKSVEKDFYIWRFLSQARTSTLEAKKIIYDVKHLNKKLRTAYKSKTGFTAPKIKSTRASTPEHIWKDRSKAYKHFKKGLSLMKQEKPKLASSYFDVARKHYKKRYEIDKTLFWLYLSTKNDVYLRHLQASYSPNIYTLMAADTVKGRYPKTITERFRKKRNLGFDVKDPIIWAKIKSKMNRSSSSSIDALATDYAAQESIGIYTYLKAKASRQKKSYFPMPYRDAMKDMSVQRQAIIYAIARQESRFVPASVSSSFALGMMQFMPFLVKHIAKEKGQDMKLEDIFDPYKALEYADYHLDYLGKYLQHPLFIAYAYNAGIGFTRRHIRNKDNFRNGPYEPYMSMETMQNQEAREYGKKVLSNYVIYLNKLGTNTRIFPLLKTLTTPSKTDQFRK